MIKVLVCPSDRIPSRLILDAFPPGLAQEDECARQS